MRWTQTLIPTQKENTAHAQIISHQLMVRAGLIRQLAAETDDFLPPGLRRQQKATQIIRQEMNANGAATLIMPATKPNPDRSAAVRPMNLWRSARPAKTPLSLVTKATIGRTARNRRSAIVRTTSAARRPAS